MAEQLEIVPAADVGAWTGWLSKTRSCDFYDRPDYHLLAEQGGDGEALLLAFESAPFTILLPLLLRPVDAVEGLEQAGAGRFDATSVYGYSGPLASHENPPPEVLGAFGNVLAEFATSRNIVSIFARLNPLRGSGALLAGLGEVQVHGPTVSIDLTLPEEEQWRGYRTNHRRNIAKLRSQGYQCAFARDDAALAEFSGIYRQTMERRDAADSYFFTDSYFRALLDMGCFEFVICRQGSEVAAAALVSSFNGVSQYHLGGTAAEHLQAAPMKLLFDETRRWASAKGCSVFHLGGGLGARCDSLFAFKAGFSDRRHDFSTWRWIVDEREAKRLEEARAGWAAAKGMKLPSDPSFPPYRSAAASIE